MKRLLFIIALTLIVGQAVMAQSTVAVNDVVTWTWNEDTKSLSYVKEDKEAISLASYAEETEIELDGQNKWYYLPESRTFRRITIKTSNPLLEDYNCHIIIEHGAILTVQNGIVLVSQKTANDEYLFPDKLHFHSTLTTAEEGWFTLGKVVVTQYEEGHAGIGGGIDQFMGNLYVHSVDITATGAKRGAGIGSGAAEDKNFEGKVFGGLYIYDGRINATGGQCAAGIGGGAGYGKLEDSWDFVRNGITYRQYGGTVTAKGGELGAGIGGGGGYHPTRVNKRQNGGGMGSFEIWGGSVTATGGYRAAGIGSGNHSSMMTRFLNNFNMDVHGGTVTATGGDYGAGIGGGCNDIGTRVSIYGGEVYAKGGKHAAGIGGGESGALGTFTMKGGKVTAEAGSDGKTHLADGSGAISSGYGYSSDKDVSNYHLNDTEENLCFKVRSGSSKTSMNAIAKTSERIENLRNRNYVVLTQCYHKNDEELSETETSNALTYNVTSSTHQMMCNYCGYVGDVENHNTYGTASHCSICGYDNYGNAVVLSFYEPNATGTGWTLWKEIKVVNGTKFPLPGLDRDGLELKGWMTEDGIGNPPSGIYMLDSETTYTHPAGEELSIPYYSYNKFYARFRKAWDVDWQWSNHKKPATVTITHIGNESEKYTFSGDEITYEETIDGEGQLVTSGSITWSDPNVPNTTYTFTDEVVQSNLDELTLDENNNNVQEIDEKGGCYIKKLTIKRTIALDNTWYTLCLPFDFQVLGSLFYKAGVDIRELTGSSFKDGVLTLTFSDNLKDGTLKAGRPYLVRYEIPGGDPIVNPTFENYTINSDYNDIETDYVSFVGLYEPVTLKANERDVLYMGKNNNLNYPTVDLEVKGFRGLFILNNLEGGDVEQYSIVCDFGDETTEVENINALNNLIDHDEYYDLSGRKLSSKPTTKGIFINKNKKVIIK